MLRKRLYLAFSLLMIASMLLAACGTKEKVVTQIVNQTQIVKETQVVVTPGEVTTQIVTQEVTKVETQVVTQVVTQEVMITPTPSPVTRKGAWVDKVVFTSIDQAESAVKQLQAGDIDVYAYGVSDPAVYDEVKGDSSLSYTNSFGLVVDLTFNPVGPEFNDGRLNPFSDPKIREAMNWLIDRNYIVQEIFGGLAKPKFTLLNSAFPDAARYPDLVAQIETEYAYNPDKAKSVITTEMEGLGASLNSDGKWTYKDQVITLIFLIRTEDKRRDVGDYVSNQLETIGFTVDRQYKTSAEASAIWVRGDPADGGFNIYTGGWINPAIVRDNGSDFSFFYTPRDYPIPLWQAYKPDPAFDAVALKLRNNDFSSMAERRDLFAQALPMSLKDSVRIWVVDQIAISPQKANVQVAYDLAGGVQGSSLWPYTIRFKDQVGGTMRVAQPAILVDPWNPVAGSNWIYDAMPQTGTADSGLIADPYTGLRWPERIEKAEVTVKEGLPVAKTLDWVTLDTAPSIEVPGDAWAAWDPVNEKFIPASEYYTETQTANVKTVVTYPSDLWTTVKWHDGSPISMGDFVMGMIMNWAVGQKGSPIYDASQEETVNAFQAHFKGLRITSTDPLVIETYDDNYQLDAELNVTTWWPEFGSGYPYGSGAWHDVALGVRAEMTGTLAFSSAKADEMKVEWMSLIAGPSLAILKGELDKASAENYIPFANTMSQYVTADEATLRWQNLTKWYKTQGNFWLGTGPFYLDKAYPIEASLTLSHNDDFVDTSGKWDRFGEPKIADVQVDGPGQVAIGSDATFDIYITFNGDPYANADIDSVSYLLFDATGALVAKGDATPVEDGHYQAVLSGTDVTSKLTAGSNKLVVAVASKVVSVPTFADYEFVTTAP